MPCSSTIILFWKRVRGKMQILHQTLKLSPSLYKYDVMVWDFRLVLSSFILKVMSYVSCFVLHFLLLCFSPPFVITLISFTCPSLTFPPLWVFCVVPHSWPARAVCLTFQSFLCSFLFRYLFGVLDIDCFLLFACFGLLLPVSTFWKLTRPCSY